MMREETFNKLSQMRMHGLSLAFREQLDQPAFHEMDFEDRVGMMVDREWTERETRRLTRRLQQAKLREQACVEDIDYHHPRGLDRALLQRLSTSRWVEAKQNVIITGPTGVGKTFLACALVQKACRMGYGGLYRRLPRLVHELLVARADGSLTKLLAKLAKTDVLVIDDWGLSALGDQERRDLLEVLEDRVGERSTIVASQVPVKDWHTVIGEPTVADAFLDRIVHNAHRLVLTGESMRKKRSRLTEGADSVS